VDAWRLRWQTDSQTAFDDPTSTSAAVQREIAPAHHQEIVEIRRGVVDRSSAVAHVDHQESFVPPPAALPAAREAADPFVNPFGDSVRSVLAPAEPVALQPATPDELPGPPPASPPPAPAESIRRQLAQPDAGGDMAQPCDHVYNGRNCCDESDRCQRAREYVRTNSIRNISLDITPQYTVARVATNDAPERYQQELELLLARSPSRRWHNRDGQVVAEGQLADMRHGQAIIRTADGDTVRIPFAELPDDESCFVTAWWSIPSECALTSDQLAQRSWIPTTLTWKASAICHKPLYFEDVQLERYGHSAGPLAQPLLSGAHFFAHLVALPYQMGISPPFECEYPLGYYRPGSCAPWLVPPVPLSVRGALLEAGVITGGIYVLP
jgi:hypothetical protein